MNNDGTYTSKLTINLSDITAAVLLSVHAYDIFSATISRTPIKDNIYNICITGRTHDYDNRAYYVVRIDLDNWSLYEDDSYSTYLGITMNDAWGGQSDLGYRVNYTELSNEFLTFPVAPRTSGIIQGWQRLAKIVISPASVSLVTVNSLSNPSNVLRWSTISEDGNYTLINLSNNTSEGVFNSSNLNKLITPAGMSCFVRNGTTNYLIVGNKTLRDMSNIQLADYSSIIQDGFYYLFGHQNILYVIYSSYISIYEIDFSSNYALTLVGRVTVATSKTSTTNYTRFTQAPFYDLCVYTGHASFKCINKIYTETVDKLPNQFYTNTYKLYRPYLDYDTKASEILYGKKAIALDGRVTGTMPNNGELNYTSSESDQTIPAGYTSGGTISGISIYCMVVTLKK